MLEAVIETGGKQYRVKEGDVVPVERVGDQKSISLKPLAVTSDGKLGDASKATVKGTITGEAKGPKLVVFKMKAKKRSRTKGGHRQNYALLKIEKISA